MITEGDHHALSAFHAALRASAVPVHVWAQISYDLHNCATRVKPEQVTKIAALARRACRMSERGTVSDNHGRVWAVNDGASEIEVMTAIAQWALLEGLYKDNEASDRASEIDRMVADCGDGTFN